VRDAVTILRHQLDMSTRLLLEELLAHRPELLQARVLDSLSLWWDKWRARRVGRADPPGFD
jgi:hypothetical protein